MKVFTNVKLPSQPANADNSEEVVTKNVSSYLSSKTYVVGTQKNHLNEMAHLSTQNTGFNQ